MKKYLLPLIGLICSCGDSGSPGTTPTDKALEVATEVSTNITDTLCFIRTEGLKNEDTAAIRLVIHNNDVSGTMMHMPYEKDWRRGTLRGEKRGNTVSGTWTYTQEGMKDSIRVSFRLDKDRLMQKATVYDAGTGREMLPDSSTYRLEFYKVDCSGFPGS